VPDSAAIDTRGVPSPHGPHDPAITTGGTDVAINIGDMTYHPSLRESASEP
jgi:hypothetical protein